MPKKPRPQPNPTVLHAEGLEVRFRLPSLPFQTRFPNAVDGVSLSIKRGETLALIGESGSGKTTLARTIAGLQRIDGGTIRIGRKCRAQFVFQNPQTALDPSYNACLSVTEPVRLKGQRDQSLLRHRVVELLHQVGLGKNFWTGFPMNCPVDNVSDLGLLVPSPLNLIS